MTKKTWFRHCLWILGVFLVMATGCKKEDKPLPVITTHDVANILVTTAISGGNITSDGGLLVLARGVCWGTDPKPTLRDNKTTDGQGAGNFFSELTGLLPGTTYYLRAYATTDAGTAYGSTLVFTTLVLSALSTHPVTDITLFTAKVGGTITSDGGTPITARGICWSTSPEPTIEDNLTHEGDGTGSFTSSLTDLVNNTTYYVRAYATNSGGTAYGNQVVFKTLDYPNCGTVTDTRDGYVYQTVQIGNQCWLRENMRYLPSVMQGGNWSSPDPRYYVYGYFGNDVTQAKATETYKTYGVLYNWVAAKTACPAGWHLPSDEEWTQLENYLGGAGTAAGKLKAITHWESPSPYDTNETGFTALPGGVHLLSPAYFSSERFFGFWWSSTESSTSSAWERIMKHNQMHVQRGIDSKAQGNSVRCIKD